MVLTSWEIGTKWTLISWAAWWEIVIWRALTPHFHGDDDVDKNDNDDYDDDVDNDVDDGDDDDEDADDDADDDDDANDDDDDNDDDDADEDADKMVSIRTVMFVLL